MTKPKYASAEERHQAVSARARAQMRAQWEAKRGDEPLGYFGCHRRVRKERGRAKDQVCPCGKPARHWAHLHDTDPADTHNYQAMCQPCHWAYDRVGAKILAAKGPDGPRQIALLAWSRRSPERRREIARKALATRRRNAAERGAAAGARADRGSGGGTAGSALGMDR